MDAYPCPAATNVFACVEHQDWPTETTAVQPWKAFMQIRSPSAETNVLLCVLNQTAVQNVQSAFTAGGGY
jgi:hypothetical protein